MLATAQRRTWFWKADVFTSVQIPNGAVGSVAEEAAQTRRQSETSATWSQPYPVLASEEPMSPWLRSALCEASEAAGDF